MNERQAHEPRTITAHVAPILVLLTAVSLAGCGGSNSHGSGSSSSSSGGSSSGTSSGSSSSSGGSSSSGSSSSGSSSSGGSASSSSSSSGGGGSSSSSSSSGGGSSSGSSSSSSGGSSGSSSGGSGGVTAQWIALAANPLANTTGGANGVYLIPANSLTTTPVMVAGPTNPISVAVGLDAAYSSGVVSYAVKAALYAGTGSDNAYHLYGLDLSTATLPSAVQVSNLVVPFDSMTGQPGCNGSTSQTQANESDPKSLIFVISVPVAPSTDCTAGTTNVLINYGAAAGAAPTPTPLSATGFDAVYTAGGALGGVAQTDATGANSNTLNFYAYTGGNFVAGPAIATGLQSAYYFGASLDDTEVFEQTVDGMGAQHIYGINASGATVFQYSAQGTLGDTANDATKFYFADVTASNVVLYYVPYATTGPSTATMIATLSSATYGEVSLIGSASNGASLLFYGTVTTGASETVTVYGVSGGAVTMLASLVTTSNSRFPPDLFLDSTGTYLYANFVDTSSNAYATEVFNAASGAVLQPARLHSEFLTDTYVSQSALLRLSGLGQGANGTDSGATVDSLNTASLSTGTVVDPSLVEGPSPLGIFAVPTGYTFNAFLLPVEYSNASTPVNVGSAYLQSSSATAGNQVAVYDVSKGYMIPVSLGGTATTANTTLFPF